MTEFTTQYNGKEITFTEEGIRYDGKVFIRYEDMEDITHRLGSESAIIFKYKEHLVKMRYDASDEEQVSEYLKIAMKTEEPVEEPEDNPLDKFSYLDQSEEKPEEPEEKKGKKGIVVAAILLVAVLIGVGMIILL